MIELLLQAERSLDAGLLDEAERIYWQAVERDPRNAIAVVGLARVAIERGDERTGYRFALKALEIDPENATARRLALRMGEVIEYRGDALPERPADLSAPSEGEGTAAEAAPDAGTAQGTAADAGTAEGADADAGTAEGADGDHPPVPEPTTEPETRPSETAPAPTEAGPPAEVPAFGSVVVPPPLVVPARRRGLVARLLRRR